MDKENLLKLIAESAYNIGFGAKKNLATFDIIEKSSGWISVVSFAIGIFALFIPALASNFISAIMLIFGISTLYFGIYQQDKEKYSDAGKKLTNNFHELKTLYYILKSNNETTDISEILQKLNSIVSEASESTITKQIFLSDWYAHLKFFGQNQIGWVDEQLKFRFWRDKVPSSLKLILIAFMSSLVFVALYKHLISYLCSIS